MTQSRTYYVIDRETTYAAQFCPKGFHCGWVEDWAQAKGFGSEQEALEARNQNAQISHGFLAHNVAWEVNPR